MHGTHRDTKAMAASEFEHEEIVDRAHGGPVTVRIAAENGGATGRRYRRWLYRAEDRGGEVVAHGDMNTRSPKTHEQAVAALVESLDYLFDEA